MKTILQTMLVGFLAVQSLSAEDSSLLKALERVEDTIRENKEAFKDKDAALQAASQSVYHSEGLAAMIQLWKSGERGQAELAWWRSPYPNARMLAIALFYSTYSDVDVPQFPRFEKEATRFGEEESKQRLAELRQVKNNLPAIRKRLMALLGKD